MTRFRPWMLLCAWFLFVYPPLDAQTAPVVELPEAPRPQLSSTPIHSSRATCEPEASSEAEAWMCCSSIRRFDSPSIYLVPAPLSVSGKLNLAWRQFIDPFNILTIAGEAAVTTASDPSSAYGPGMKGFARYAGVSASQGAVANFFGIFLIPSLAHQDPRYFRRSNLPVSQRIRHVFYAVAVGNADDGRPMFNYAQVFGTIATSLVGNAYVPGRRTGPGASTARIGVALATIPIGNAIAEFLPDVARHININVVLVQKVINRIAITRQTTGGL